MLGGIVTWFAATKIGRAIAAGFAVAAAVGIFALKLFNAGKRSERVKQDRDSLKNLRNRQERNEELENLGPADLDRRMRRWVRDDTERR